MKHAHTLITALMLTRLAYFLAAGRPLSEAARRAGAIATRSVLKPGTTQTSFPDREELADILGAGP